MVFIKVQRAEQQLIRKSHPKWSVIDQMCFNSKNLYNYANYIVRQEFVENGNYISYRDMNKMTNQEITPEEAMSILYTTEGQTELRLCMEAGF